VMVYIVYVRDDMFHGRDDILHGRDEILYVRVTFYM
jgi:hypothetical protein